MKKIYETLSIVILCITSIFLIGLQLKPISWLGLVLSFLVSLKASKQFRKDLFLIIVSLIFLGITPINTDLSNDHFLLMGGTLLAALLMPITISKYIYKENIIKFNLKTKKKWFKSEIIYIIITTIIVYFLLPFYLKSTQAYLNWDVPLETFELLKLFIGINLVVLFDELFFIATVLVTLNRHFSFLQANIFQGIIFTSFLYELGYTSWGPIMIFLFAILQGYIFNRTKSLTYVIIIHLIFDLILFFALINSYYPNLLNIFLT